MNQHRPVAVITGASRGIGAATAVELARQGYDLWLMSRNRQLLEDNCQQARLLGSQASAAPGDLADLDYAHRAIRAAEDHYGRIDLLVNNAVWRRVESINSTDVETWEKTLRVCLTAPAFLARWAGEAMIRQQSGVIVNVSSIRARRVDGVCSAYAACKGALDSLTYDLAAQWGPSGIRVVGISPGAVDTQSSHDLADEHPMETILDDFLDRTPLQRIAQPEEIARMIAVLAGPDASYVTGTVITVDGGHSHTDYGRRIQRQIRGRPGTE